MLLVVLLPTSVHAQVGCAEVRACREDFMPKPNAQPDPVEIATVQTLIDVAKAADDEEEQRMRDLEKIRGGRQLRDPGMLKEPEYLLALQRHADAVRANFAAHNAAIVKAVEVYELTPPNIDFTRDSRAALNNTSRSWLPRYSIRERVNRETGGPRRRNTKELEEEKQDGGASQATTWDNGEISLFNQAFKSPEELAITIFHETSHWVDGVAKPGGFRRSDPPAVRYRTEQVAYEHSAAFARSLGVDATRYESLADKLGRQAVQAEAENLRWDQVQILHPQWIMKTRPSSYSLAAGPAGIEREEEDVLQRGMEQAKSAVERSRMAREVAGGSERRVPIEPVKAEPISTSPKRESSPASTNDVGIIRQIAIKACMSAPMPFERDLGWIQWNVVSRMDLGQWPEAPGDCERRVYVRLAEFARSWVPGMTITPAEVQSAAAGNSGIPWGGGAPHQSPSHDPVWGKIGVPRPH